MYRSSAGRGRLFSRVLLDIAVGGMIAVSVIATRKDRNGYFVVVGERMLVMWSWWCVLLWGHFSGIEADFHMLPIFWYARGVNIRKEGTWFWDKQYSVCVIYWFPRVTGTFFICLLFELG